MKLKESLERKFPKRKIEVNTEKSKTFVDVDGKIFCFGFVVEEKNFVSCERFVTEEIEHDLKNTEWESDSQSEEN